MSTEHGTTSYFFVLRLFNLVLSYHIGYIYQSEMGNLLRTMITTKELEAGGHGLSKGMVVEILEILSQNIW